MHPFRTNAVTLPTILSDLQNMPPTQSAYHIIDPEPRDIHFNGHHGVTSHLLYKMLALLILSISIPALVLTILGSIDVLLSKRDMTYLVIMSLGCPTGGIVLVCCVVLWRFECMQMRNYDLEML